MSILKVEAFSGLSGDMFLGALAELTDGYDELVVLPRQLQLEHVEVEVTEVEKARIACKHVKVLDHNDYSANSKHDLQHGHHHHHEHGEHTHAHGHKPHRHLKDIHRIIDQGQLTANAKTIAKKIFQLLGAAESKVHGVSINKIHFHEVGAIDSILDIVGTAVLLDKLALESTVSTPICTGHGFVMADHGRMPIPAPATKELLLGIPTYAGMEKGEMTTPTGAAILKFLDPSFDLPVLIERRIGHGPGEKDFEHPNVLRLSICEFPDRPKDEIMVIETNIDDMSSELLGTDFQDKLLDVGALDFYYTQVVMKKGRPGLVISVLSPPSLVPLVTSFLLENTSTIGVRSFPASRTVLKRNIYKVSTSMGDVDVKEVELPSGEKRKTLEYASCRRIAEQHNATIAEVYEKLQKEI